MRSVSCQTPLAVADARRRRSPNFCSLVLTVRPNDWQARNNLGKLLHQQGRLAEAEKEYRAALGYDATYGRLCYNLATLLHTRGDPTAVGEAEALYRRAMAADPRAPEAFYNLALLLAYWDKGDGEVEALLRAALRANAGYAPARQALERLLAPPGPQQALV
jgi:Flp pilus assembly protein TadD